MDERRLVWMVHRGVGRWWFDVGASCSLIGVNGGAGFGEPGWCFVMAGLDCWLAWYLLHAWWF